MAEAGSQPSEDGAVKRQQSTIGHGAQISLDTANLLVQSRSNPGQGNLIDFQLKPKILYVSQEIVQNLEKELEEDLMKKDNSSLASKCKSICETVKLFFCCCREPTEDGKKAEWKCACNSYWNEDIRARWVRFVMISSIPIAMLFIMNELTDGGWGTETYYLSGILGIAIALMFTLYFVSLVIQLGPRRVARVFCQCCPCPESCHPKQKDDGSYFFKIETRLSQGIHFTFHPIFIHTLYSAKSQIVKRNT